MAAAGGIVGRVNSAYKKLTILRCSNHANVTSYRNAGGILGYLSSGTAENCKITNCYNVGDVSAVRYVGGIAGYSKTTIENCFNYGFVRLTDTAEDEKGGIYGKNSDGTITNCYYLEGHIYRKTTKLTDKEGYATSSSVTGNPLSADAFKLQTSFDNWDFTDVWMMGTDYPVFIPKHNHELTYEANGATITATCSAEGCPVEGHTASITIYAPEDLEYTGQAFACTLTKDYNKEFFPNPIIKYYDSNDQEVQSVVDVGSYTAKLQFGDAVATLALVVTPQQPMQGDGTEANPYQIKRKDQLEEFRDIVNGLNGKTKNNSACGKLTADIDLNNEEWTPIGNTDNEYKGTFDGNKKTIKGLAISGTGNCVGLFGCIYGATIKNLIVEGSVSGDTCVGGIVGYAHAYAPAFATITGCTSNVTVTGARRVGGFVGEASQCNVSYCGNIGDITGTDNDNVGGTGGVVGIINYSTTISNCFNNGKIVSVCNAGGIVGYNYSNASSHNWVITNCYNTGDIEVTVGYAGGITSYNNGAVEKCHNVGKVITPNTGTKAAEYAGGIIGMFSDKDAYAPINCYYLTGCVQGKTDRAGRRYQPSDPISFVGNPYSADRFKDSTSFYNWDFTNVWMMGTDYPVFIPKHDHELTYEVNGATITATCSAEGCPLENNQATLTLVAPENLECDGNAKVATFEAGYNTKAFPNATINYFKDNKAVNECVYPGTYVAKVTFGNVTAEVEFTIEGHYHDGIIYKKWEATDSLPTTAGNYYLANDVILSSAWNVPDDGTTKLCLNGHGIIGNGFTGMMIYASTSSTLVIDDCGSNLHKYTVADDDLYNGAGLATVNDNLTENYLTFKGGYITGGNSATYADFAAITAKNNGVITINGGTIIGNKNTSGHGAALYSSDYGSLVINGGSIIYNLCQQAGPAVFSRGNGILHINGGVFAYNASEKHSMACVNTDGSAELHMSGSPIIKDNYGPSDDSVDLRLETPIIFDGEFTPMEKIGVHVGTSNGEFTTNWNERMGEKDPYDYFFSQDEDKPYIGFKNGNLALFAEKQVAMVSNTSYTSLLDAYNACAENGTITLLEDIDLTQENVTISITNSITIDLNGKILKFAENQIVLSGSANLTIDNSKIKTGGINGIIPETASASVTFKNARTNLTKEEIAAASYLKLDDGFVASNIKEDGSADTNGFKTIIRSSEVAAVAEINCALYPSFIDAYNDWEEGDVIKLLADLDLTGKGAPYLTIKKNIVIDLNGHIITSANANEGVIYVYEKNHIEIFNSVKTAGGFKGGINPIINDVSKEYAYVIFGVGVRFPAEAEQLDFDNLVIYRLADECIVKNINANKSADENGFISIIGKAYSPLTPDGTPTVNKPDHTPLYVGDEITVSTDANPVVIKWYYVDENGNPTGEPIGEGTTYTIKKPNDLGKKIVAVITQTVDENGDPITENIPTQTTEVIEVFIPMDPTEEIEVERTNTYPKGGDEISVDLPFAPATVKWYYDDNGDGLPDDPTNPIGEGTTYTVKCPDPNNPLHDDTGHTIIAVITQDNDEFGNPYDEDKKPVITTTGVKVYTPLKPNEKTSVKTPNHQPLFGGDDIEVETKATDVTIEWFYDDDKNGLPDDPANPIGEGKTYTVKTNKDDQTHNDDGHIIIARVTQNKDENGDAYADEDKPRQYSNGIEIYKTLDTNPEHKPDIEVPGDKDEVEDGDEISVDTDANPVTIEWFYDDNGDGLPDDPEHPLDTGTTYTVKTPDKENEQHNDRGHTIIGVITQPKKPDGSDYPADEVPTISTNPVKVAGKLPKEIEVQVGKFYLFGDTIVFPEDVVVAANPEESITQKAGKVLVTYNIRKGAMVQFYDMLTDTNGIIHQLYVEPISPITSASEIVGLKCVSGDGTSANPYVFMAVTENDLYTPLDPTQKAELDKPTHTPLLDGDVLTVETDANPVTIEWFYDDDGDGLPDDPDDPLDTGTTYTVKCPDDEGHKIIARVTQDKKEDGTDYPEGEKPVTYTDPIEVYTPFVPDPENPVTIDIPGSKPKAENGDQIYVDVDGDPVTVKWYYDDDHDGQPDDPANPIGEGKEYIVVCPDSEDPTHDDTGHTIIAVITQDKKPDGTDYPEGEAPTETTGPIVVKGNIGGFTPIDTSEKPVVVIPGDKEEAEEGDVLTVETDTKPVIVTWYYDDDNDGRPDSATPIGTGKTYTVVCPDPNDSTHDDTGHKIIAIIKQTKDENGDDILPSRIKQVASDAIKVEGVIPHTHNFTYKVNGTTITAKCNNAYCPITEGLTLTLVAPTGNMVYDGQPRVATLKAGYNAEAFPGATIKYFQGTTEVASCVNAGTYVAKVTFGTATAQVVFTIENWKEQDADHTEVAAEIVGAAKDENIHIKVEVKTTVSAQQTSPTDYEAIKAKLAKDEEISKVYDVKLIRTVNGQSTEIQPSDIKEGTTIIVTMDIPEGMAADFRILHIHGPNDTEFVENFTVLGKKVSFSVTRLSEFAFVAKKVNTNHGFCVGWVLFILVMLEALFLAFCSIPQILRKFDLEDKKEYFQNIGLFSSIAVTIFGIVAIAVDSCVIGLASYGAAMAIIICYVVFLVLRMRHKTN